MRIAHLGRPGGDPDGFAALREAFVTRNPGYDLAWLPRTTALASLPEARIAFVQSGQAKGSVGERASPLGCGDVIVLAPGESLALDAPLAVLVFSVPDPVDRAIPTFLRPDHDPALTDTPGGCATDAGAYRRVVLTWLDENGPFRYRALNCHRVRMTDSFSHYHPEDGGFDEMYLVQGVEPGGRLFTSAAVTEIERPDEVARERIADLVVETPIADGDLVWVGRGHMHRAVGGVLAHVITVPGFVPGSEIGLDHHLRALDERLPESAARRVPYHEGASHGPVIK
jgi:hypothetical protein